jgi:acetyl-CoA synthetase
MADATKVQLKEIYPIPEAAKKKAWVSGRAAYDNLWKRSVEEPEKFWAEIAEQQVTWFKKWDKVMDYNFDIKKGPIYVKFFEGGKLNVSYNCLDRHLEKRGNQVAIQWEGNEPGEARGITYKELHEEVCKFANVLKAQGVKKGDRVCLYMPMVPELGIAALACSRIGAVHCIVFGGFSADALRDRIVKGEAKVLVVCDGTFRGAKAVPAKTIADEALTQCPSVKSVIVVKRVGDKIKCE